MIRANFSVIRDTARYYTEVSQKYIMPGVDLVDKLGESYDQHSTQEATMVSRMIKLKSYQDDAVQNITKLVTNVSIANEKASFLMLQAC